MPKKPSGKKVGSNRADQYMLRFPEGMRARLAKLAEANGRSMNNEIIEAIEKHLVGTDRTTQLWDFFERHRENIETIPLIRAAVENLEIYAGRSGDDFRGGLRALREHKAREAREASRPLVTSDQVQTIKAILEETGTDETKFLRVMKAPRIEEIRDFERAINVIEAAQRSQEDPPA